MTQQKIDYDALAEQVRQARPGGVTLSGVDFDALAEQARREAAASEPVARPRDMIGFANNLVTSGGRFIRDTAQGVWDLGKFGARLAAAQAKAQTGDPSEIQRLGREFATLVQNSPEIGKALVSALGDRYGSPEAFFNTFYNDPVGFAADISTITGAGALAAGSRAPRLAAVLSRVERFTNPVNAAVPAARVASRAGAPLKARGVSVYERALKPKETRLKELPSSYGTTPAEKARTVSEQLIREGANITHGGRRRLSNKISELDTKVDELIAANVDKRAPTRPIVESMEETRDRFRRQLAPGDDLKALDDVEDAIAQGPLRNPEQPLDVDVIAKKAAAGEVVSAEEMEALMDAGFVSMDDIDTALSRPEMPPQWSVPPLTPMAEVPIAEPVIPRSLLDDPATLSQIRVADVDVRAERLRPDIPVEQMQELKRGTYARLGPKQYAGELKSAAVEGEKAAARGAMRSIESVIPEVAAPNKEMSRLFNLTDVLDDALTRVGKHNVVGLGDLVAAAHGNPSWLAASLSNRPAVASRIGRGLYGTGARLSALSGAKVPLSVQRGALVTRMGENADEEVDPLFELLLRRAMEGR